MSRAHSALHCQRCEGRLCVFKGRVLVPGKPDECQILGLNSVYSEVHMLLSSLGSTGIRRGTVPAETACESPGRLRMLQPALLEPLPTKADTATAFLPETATATACPTRGQRIQRVQRMPPTRPGDAPWAAAPWAGPCWHTDARETSSLILNDPPVNHRACELPAKPHLLGKAAGHVQNVAATSGHV